MAGEFSPVIFFVLPEKSGLSFFSICVIVPSMKKLNVDIFEKLDSNIKAYWLGFLAADGYIYDGPTAYCVGVGLAKHDLGHIEKFRDFLECDYTISEDDNSYSLRISNPKFCNDVRRLGIEERKSTKNYSLISKVPDRYKDSFIAGYFDGDGAVFSYVVKSKYKDKVYENICYRVQIDGNEKTLKDIKRYLNDNYEFDNIRIIPHSSIFRIIWNRQHDVREFYKLYKKSNQTLVRKEKIFKEFSQERRQYSVKMD